MDLLKIGGSLATVLAGAVIGVRLLLLASRTKELPELVVGLSFILAMGLSGLLFLVADIRWGYAPHNPGYQAFVTGGLLVAGAGTVSSAIGNWKVFRSNTPWALAMVIGFLVLLGGLFSALVLAPNAHRVYVFYATMVSYSLVRFWTAAECLTLARVLHKRARLGLADPVVVNRSALWGGAALLACLSLLVLSAHGLLVGAEPAANVRIFLSICSLAIAGLDWLAFFPPEALKRRLMAAYEGA